VKVLVSHSWQEKQLAQEIVAALDASHQVWLDIRELYPGDDIQQTIDRAIASMDLVVVLWSQAAAASPSVATEIACAVARGRRIIPCRVDQTPLSPELKSRLDIDFRDRSHGMMSLTLAVSKLYANQQGLTEYDQVLSGVKGYQGQIAATHDARVGDTPFWQEQKAQSFAAAWQQGTALREKLASVMSLAYEAMMAMQGAGNDAGRLRTVLDKIRTSPLREEPQLQQVAALLEQRLGALGGAMPAPAREAPDPMLAQVRDLLARAGVRAPGLDTHAQHLTYYLKSSVEVLRALLNLAATSGLPMLAQAASVLQLYFNEANDVIPDGFGVLGKLDDAFLVHNTVYLLVQNGAVAAQQFPVDWNAIVQGNQLAAMLLPPQAQQQLMAVIGQLLSAPLAASDDFAAYGAADPLAMLMGEGQAVSPGSAGGQQSFEDMRSDLAPRLGGMFLKYGV
jgi:hypothetical protein